MSSRLAKSNKLSSTTWRPGRELVIHGIILSGGGALGAYEAGVAVEVFKKWRGTANRVRLVSGTSVGALNALATTYGGPEFAVDIWSRLRAKDIYSGGRLGFLSSAFRLASGRSLYSTDPLKRTIDREMPDWNRIRESPLQLRIHASDLASKRLIVFDNQSEMLKTGVVASASIPGAFPTIHPIEGMGLVDGGVISNTPIRSAIQAGCSRLTIIYLDNEMIRPPATFEAHQLEQVRIHGPEWASVARPYTRAKAALARSLEVMMTAHLERDLKLLTLINHFVDEGVADPRYRKVRYELIQPSAPLGTGDTLNFGRRFLDRLLARGAADALSFFSRT